MSAFKRLEAALERKGYSKDYAGGVAYKVGEEKYGKKGMEEKALAGKKKKEREEEEEKE